MVVAASCKWQHVNLIVVWESCSFSLAFVCYCHRSLLYNNKKWLLRRQHRCHVVTINIIAGALRLCNHWFGWSTSMKKVGCCLSNLVCLLQSAIVMAPSNMTERNIVVVIASCHTMYEIKNDYRIDDVDILQLSLAFSMQCKYLVGCWVAQSCIPLRNQPSLSLLLVI